MVSATRRIAAETAAAPAAAATWTSEEIALHRDGPGGLAMIGNILEAFVFQLAQPFTWTVEGMYDGTNWFTLDTGTDPGQPTLTSKGKRISVACPFPFVRLKIENTGAATATAFTVLAVVRDA